MANTKIFFREHHTCRKIMNVLYTFLHIVSGIDYGFFPLESFKVRCIANCISLVQAVSFCVACLVQTFNDEESFEFCRHLFYVFQYLLYICVFMFMKRDITLAGCLSLFQHVDLKLKIDHASYNLEMKNMLAVSSCFLCRIMWLAIACFGYNRCLTGVWKNMFYFFVLSCRDVILVANVFVFYAIKCRLVRFIHLLRTSDVDIVPFQRLYKIICDIANNIKRAYDHVYIITLLFNMIPNMMFMYLGVKQMQFANISLLEIIFTFKYLLIIDTLLLTFSPALCAAMLSTRVEEIKVLLYDKLLEEEDKNEARRLKKFISYVEARPLKFTVYKVVPLDASLPGIVLSLCITYLIVVIQFSHLY